MESRYGDTERGKSCLRHGEKKGRDVIIRNMAVSCHYYQGGICGSLWPALE